MADNFAQIVKQQADIVKIVGEYVRLRKAGAQNWSGLCPFHSEKTPSFSVHAGRQFFHCFGCGQGGDVFTFLQKIENLSFPEAVKAVAQKCGIPLPKREFNSPAEAAESRQRSKLLELHEQATAWFEQQLQSAEGATAREYLSGRGLSAEGIAKFRLGYAPDNYNALRDRLAPGADAETLRQSGLFSFKEQADGTPGPLFARFRKRIMFPIANEQGRVIAFTARALDAGDKAGPKYLNSPETPLYSKGHVLFNLDRARQPMRQLNFALLVEGQMDCISVFLGGVQNVIATSGTAFTEAQTRLLSRYTTRVIVNFDPDAAGANAAEKSIALLTEEGFEVRVVTLDDGLDPDRFIRERGVAAYTAAVRGARRHSDYLIERARQLHPPATAEGKIRALNFLLPHIRRLPNAIGRAEFATEAAHRLGIDSALVQEELKQAAAARKDRIATAQPALSEAEKVLLRALAGAPETPLFAAAAAGLDAHSECFAALASAALLSGLRRRNSPTRNGYQPAPEAADGPENGALAAVADPAQRDLLAAVLMAEGRPIATADVTAAIDSLRRAQAERRQRTVRAALADAERRADTAVVEALLLEKQALDRELREL